MDFSFAEMPAWMRPMQSKYSPVDIYRDTQARLRQQRMDAAELPLRQAAQNNETAGMLLKMQAFNTQQENQNAMVAGNAAVGATLAEISRSGLWDKPEGRAKFYETVAAHPWVTSSPGFRVLENQFDIADRAAAEAEKARIAADARKLVADTQAAAAMERTQLTEQGRNTRAADKIEHDIEVAEVKAAGRDPTRVATLRAAINATKKDDGTYDLPRLYKVLGAAEAGLPMADTMKPDADGGADARQYRSVVAKLKELKAAGATAARVGTDMVVRKAALLANDTDIDELIQEWEQKLNKLGAGEGSGPAAAGATVPVMKSYNSNAGKVK